MVGVGEISNIRIPPGIENAITKPRHAEDNHKNWVRRVKGNDNISDKMADRSQDGHATLAEVNMNPIIRGRAGNVADEGG